MTSERNVKDHVGALLDDYVRTVAEIRERQDRKLTHGMKGDTAPAMLAATKARVVERIIAIADLDKAEETIATLRAALIEIHALAQAHREWAISSRCVSALGPGVPGVSAP